MTSLFQFYIQTKLNHIGNRERQTDMEIKRQDLIFTRFQSTWPKRYVPYPDSTYASILTSFEWFDSPWLSSTRYFGMISPFITSNRFPSGNKDTRSPLSNRWIVRKPYSSIPTIVPFTGGPSGLVSSRAVTSSPLQEPMGTGQKSWGRHLSTCKRYFKIPFWRNLYLQNASSPIIEQLIFSSLRSNIFIRRFSLRVL